MEEQDDWMTPLWLFCKFILILRSECLFVSRAMWSCQTLVCAQDWRGLTVLSSTRTWTTVCPVISVSKVRQPFPLISTVACIQPETLAWMFYDSFYSNFLFLYSHTDLIKTVFWLKSFMSNIKFSASSVCWTMYFCHSVTGHLYVHVPPSFINTHCSDGESHNTQRERRN